MGEANDRGTRDERVRAAKQRVRPTILVCNNCKNECRNIEEHDSSGLNGIDGIFFTECETCTATTYAINGKPEAVAMFAADLQDTAGMSMDDWVAQNGKGLVKPNDG